MFAKTIVLSDAFLDMPLTARCLYFTLGMLADDDGFVNSPKSIIRQCGASEDDLRILIAKKFVIAFENGVIVIKHWRLNNYLRSDRYKPTVYADEKQRITVDGSGIYHTDTDKVGIPDIGIPSIGKVREGKESIGKVNNVRAESEPDSAPAVITIPLNDGSEYAVKQDDFNEWLTLYPAVDVMQELRKMRGWSQVNGAKRKTRKGIKRFIVNWLAREQDKPHADTQKKTGSGENPFLQMMRESENERTGNIEDTDSFTGGIPDVLPGVDGW